VSQSIDDLLASAAAGERACLWDAALESYGTAYEQALADGDVDTLLEVVIRIGHCERKAGNLDGAVEHFELAREIGTQSGRSAPTGRALNGLGMIMQARGRLTEAESLFSEALERAMEAGATSLAGDAQQNLGIIANIRGNLPEALRRYTLGVELLQEAGNDNAVGSALNNLGMLHVDLGELDLASSYFDRALELSRSANNVLLEGIVSVNRAELYIARGDLVRARESCDEGFEIFSQTGDILNQAEALRFYGVIYRKSGKPHLAAIHLQRAADIAAQRDPLLEAEAQRELALVLRELGRNRDALAALNRSHTLFTGSGRRRTPPTSRSGSTGWRRTSWCWCSSGASRSRPRTATRWGHCLRVAGLCVPPGGKVGIAPHEMVWFRMGAFLHDLGKIDVPEEVLNKPGRLTDEERALMERHPVTGEAMLGSVDFPGTSGPWYDRTTSGGTAAATRTGWWGRRSPSPRASCALPTSSTR
jgi:tetratricopeptide (TPR) repeat protein